jgi:hypothetical protein
LYGTEGFVHGVVQPMSLRWDNVSPRCDTADNSSASGSVNAVLIFEERLTIFDNASRPNFNLRSFDRGSTTMLNGHHPQLPTEWSGYE